MRQDFDFVLMEDYQSDMREQSRLGSSIISAQRREIRHLRGMLAAVVKRTGPVRLSIRDIDTMDKLELVVEHYAEDFSTALSAKAAPSATE